MTSACEFIARSARQRREAVWLQPADNVWLPGNGKQNYGEKYPLPGEGASIHGCDKTS